MHTLRLCFVATLGWRIISTDPDVPAQSVPTFEAGIETLCERASPEGFDQGVVYVVAASINGT